MKSIVITKQRFSIEDEVIIRITLNDFLQNNMDMLTTHLDKSRNCTLLLDTICNFYGMRYHTYDENYGRSIHEYVAMYSVKNRVQNFYASKSYPDEFNDYLEVDIPNRILVFNH
jgi:hypothetical protein